MQSGATPTSFKGRMVAAKALSRIITGGSYSNIVLKNLHDDPALAPRDRTVATSLVLGTLRNLTLIDEILRSKSKNHKLTLSPMNLIYARLCVYEIIFMSKIPQYASVFKYVDFAMKANAHQEARFMNACLRKVTPDDITAVLAAKASIDERLATEFSYPLWMVQLLIERHGEEETRSVLRAGNNPQPTYFRVNCIRATDLIERNTEKRDVFGLEKVTAPKYCLRLAPGKSTFPHDEYNNGLITPQDRSTQFPAHLLAPSSGERVLDMCCGSGIKTTQLAELSGNAADITAIDIHSHKLESLRAEAARLGITCITPVTVDATDCSHLGSFDKILLDAPCSGTGAVRRRPEIKSRVDASTVSRLATLQDALLSSAASRLNPGGTLVYSTCSILDVENGERIEKLIHSDSSLHADPGIFERLYPPASILGSGDGAGFILLPSRSNACGGYVAVIRKKHSSSSLI